MNWRLAESLKTLREQINAAYPHRNRASDGSIGDSQHASRNSDHNPWVRDRKGQPIVTAIDVTHDPRNGVDCVQLAKELVAARDPRIKYIIWNRQICSSVVSPWRWRPYKGSNPHTKHLHISVNSSQGLYDKSDDWKLGIFTTLSNKEIENAVKNDLVDPSPAVSQPVKPAEDIQLSANNPTKKDETAQPEKTVTEKLQSVQQTANSTISQIQNATQTIGQAKETLESVKSYIPASAPVEKVTSGKSKSFLLNLFALVLSFLSSVWGFLTNNWKLIAFGVLGVIAIGITVAVTFTVINHYKMKYAADPNKFNVE
ncbi:MAG: hypothetical protein ACK5NT_06520 [Pyrinomonadaceae bacterium]